MHKYKQLAKEKSDYWKLVLNLGYDEANKLNADEYYEALGALELAEDEANKGSDINA